MNTTTEAHTITRSTHRQSGADKATCSCGWTEASMSPKGLNLSIRAHLKAVKS
jgi:hypothetical protein